jgi:hypothetical protein
MAITAYTVVRAGSLWYPIMLAQLRSEISEEKAAELLGMNLIEYREHMDNAIQAVIRLVYHRLRVRFWMLS